MNSIEATKRVKQVYSGRYHLVKGTAYRHGRLWPTRRTCLWRMYARRRIVSLSDPVKLKRRRAAYAYSAAHPRTLVIVETAGGREEHYVGGLLYGVTTGSGEDRLYT